MGNSVSRPSCLGQKSQQAEEFLKDSYLKDLGLDPGHPAGRNNSEARAGAPDKSLLSPAVIENGWSLGPGAAKSLPGSPLPKQNNLEVKVQNGAVGRSSLTAQADAGGAAWPPQRGAPQRDSGSGWAWKPITTREVTEVTEVTETIVTEIVEVTEYPGSEKGGEPVVTRMVKVLTERAGERTEVNNGASRGQRPGRAGVSAEGTPSPPSCTQDSAELFVCVVPIHRPGSSAPLGRGGEHSSTSGSGNTPCPPCLHRGEGCPSDLPLQGLSRACL
ncbi:uncharacterized protein [Emydura macquarii macquarii]|uniref:uncharacterized protein n=1 Tax=Emydura macquarii macquarii TaxID=1129001 RepID=UPI00352AD35E